MRPLLLLLLAANALAAQEREYRFVSELKIDLSRENIRRGGGMLTVSPSGRMVFLTEMYRGRFLVFDTAGKDQGWSLTVGRGRDTDIGWVRQLGWIGDSLWVEDQMYDQIVVVNPAGTVVRSVERPSWVRPRWSERRKYPFFASMEWAGLNPDGTLLVLPRRPRALFDTPLYDRSFTHLVRADKDGLILGTVARVPALEGQLEFRDGTERRTQRVDFFARPFWRASSDGQRVAVVTQSRTDSGAFNVTMLTANGDTVYSRRFVATSKRIPATRKDTLLSNVRPLGRIPAATIRDSLRSLMSEFEPPVTFLSVGLDGSVWVWLREPGAPVQDWVMLILDPAGDAVGRARVPRSMRPVEVTQDRLWALTRGERNQLWIERFRREPVTAARPSRTGRTSAPSR